MSLGPYLCITVVVPANNDFRRKKSPEIVETMNHCRSAPLRGIGTIHNPHTTQKITDRKQVVCRVVDHNYRNIRGVNIEQPNRETFRKGLNGVRRNRTQEKSYPREIEPRRNRTQEKSYPNWMGTISPEISYPDFIMLLCSILYSSQ